MACYKDISDSQVFPNMEEEVFSVCADTGLEITNIPVPDAWAVSMGMDREDEI